MKEAHIRPIFYYKHYYLDFFQSLNSEVKTKLIWTIKFIATNQSIPVVILKRIENAYGLYEIRLEVETNFYRVFCFFDQEKLIILINGFRTKSKRTSIREIELGQKIKKEYFYGKNGIKPIARKQIKSIW